jgi:hypothetical protein
VSTGAVHLRWPSCIRVVRIVLGLLLFEKLFYSGCSSRKHTTPAWFLGKANSKSVLVAGSTYNNATILLNASEIFEHSVATTTLIQKERYRSLRSLQRELSSCAAAAPLSPRGLPQLGPEIHHALRVYPCIKASGLAPALVQQQRLTPPFKYPSSEERCLTVFTIFRYFPAILLSLHLADSESYAHSFHSYLVEMISKSVAALSILALTSFVNAAPAGQSLLGPIVREGLC